MAHSKLSSVHLIGFGAAFVALFGCGSEADGSGSGGQGTGAEAGSAGSAAGGAAGQVAAAGSGGDVGTGGNASGGTAGAAGSGPTGPVLCGDAALIDNMEDDDAWVCPDLNRWGAWYLSTDGSGTLEIPAGGATEFTVSPIDAGRPGSVYAARVKGTGYTGFGVWFGMQVYDGALNVPYDASGFSGIRFWAKGTSPVAVRVTIRTAATTPTDSGGTCVPTGTELCGDHLGAEFTLLDLFADTWMEHTIPFSSMAQAGYGVPAQLDLTKFMGVEFRLNYPNGAPFDVWIDDVAFDY
jgi:hypothetical protein